MSTNRWIWVRYWVVSFRSLIIFYNKNTFVNPVFAYTLNDRHIWQGLLNNRSAKRSNYQAKHSIYTFNLDVCFLVHYTVAIYLSIHLSICPSVRPSIRPSVLICCALPTGRNCWDILRRFGISTSLGPRYERYWNNYYTINCTERYMMFGMSFSLAECMSVTAFYSLLFIYPNYSAKNDQNEMKT